MLLLAAATPEIAASANGMGNTPGFGSVVKVREEGATLQASIRWLWQPGKGEVGQPLFQTFSNDQGRCRGRILNSEDGRTYEARLRP